MSNFIYAQLAADNTVIAISQLSGEVIHPQLIRIDNTRAATLGDVYQNGAFVAPEPDETAEPGA